jgi:diadenosine tetraphosphate (Ap4A) HIT family hydrolase
MPEETKSLFVDIENTRNPEQRAWYQRIIDEGIDPFEEENFKKRHPNPILFENRHWIVTTNAVPYENCKHHFLLVPKRFLVSLEEMAPMTWTDLHEAIAFVKNKYDVSGYAFFMRSGSTAKTGASVARLHAHIVVPAGEDCKRTSIYPVITEPE